MADELQYSSVITPNKRKYQDQTAPPSSVARRPTGFSAPIKSAPDPVAAPPSYNNVPQPVEDFQAAKRRAEQIAARLLNSASVDGKRARVDNGSGFDSVDRGYSSPTSVSYGGFQGTCMSKKIEVPNMMVGVIIGKSGETIKYLQLQSGAKIQVTRGTEADLNSPTRSVELVGTPEQIAKAEQFINDVLAEPEAGSSGTVAQPLTGQGGSNHFAMRVLNNKLEVEKMKEKQGVGDNSTKHQNVGTSGRHVILDSSVRKREDDNADRHLAQKIMQNKQYSMSGWADDEYDFEDGPSQKSRKKKGTNDNKGAERAIARRIWTQQERCLFCFESPNRPKHLVVAIANFTYLMLPQWQPVVPGHCCILPLQHESASRTVDNHVWDEIRNFKKCLIMMFAKQEKELVFLETMMGLGQQRRHCLIECIPLPQKIAKQAPVYFKKAIDEAEDEWSQHSAKKLIDTSVKGLHGSIPKDFPYFHVEFGLNKGFLHVIDDETQFKSSFGLNVIRGMLRLPEEDMYHRRRREPVEAQKHAVAAFAQEWENFDWTKQLD